MTTNQENYFTSQLSYQENYQGNILPAIMKVKPFSGLDIIELGAGTGRLT